MKLWIGHSRRDEKQWFIIWANSKDRAIDHIDSVIGKLYVHSMRPLDTPGFVHFKVEMVEDKRGFHPIFVFGKNYLDLDPYSDEASDWIVERIRNPFKGHKKLSADTEMAGIAQPVKSRNMKMWIGHKCEGEKEKEWFIVWANSKEQAEDVVDIVYTPYVQSMRPLDTPGFICFKAEIVTEDGDYFYPAFIFDRNILHFDNDKPCKWVVERIKKERDKRQKAIENFSCQRCGKCCREKQFKRHLGITYNDLKKWRDLGRDDILQYCEIHLPDDRRINGINWDGQLILGCNMFDEHSPGVCPFLQKVDNKNVYKCGIHDIKPEICREYPKNTWDGICSRMEEEKASQHMNEKDIIEAS